MGSSDLVRIDFVMPDYLALLDQGMERLQIAIASDIQTNVGLRFDNEGAYNGHQKWRDLRNGSNLTTAKNGLRTRNILRKTGALKNSISPQGANGKPGQDGYVRFSGTRMMPTVTVGTALKYARIHNEGGVIQHPGTTEGFGPARYVRRNGRLMKIGGRDIRPHGINIPKRNYTDWNELDMLNTQRVVKNTVVKILNGSK